MKRILSAAIFGVLVTHASVASAASLGLNLAGAPVISGQGQAWNDPLLEGFNLFGMVGGASSTAPATATDLDVLVPSVVLDMSDPFFGGAFFVTDIDGFEFLSGDLIEVGFVTSDLVLSDTIELLFGNLTGNTAFGTRVLLTLFGEFGGAGDDPIAEGFASFDDLAFVSFTIAPVAAIPLPATAPLLLTALIGAGLARRRSLQK